MTRLAHPVQRYARETERMEIKAMKNTFRLEGTLRENGTVRFACDDLPGFRLVLEAKDEPTAYNDDLIEALNIFVPLYVAAEVRNKTYNVSYDENGDYGRGRRDIKLVASFAA